MEQKLNVSVPEIHQWGVYDSRKAKSIHNEDLKTKSLLFISLRGNTGIFSSKRPTQTQNVSVT